MDTELLQKISKKFPCAFEDDIRENFEAFKIRLKEVEAIERAFKIPYWEAQKFLDKFPARTHKTLIENFEQFEKMRSEFYANDPTLRAAYICVANALKTVDQKTQKEHVLKFHSLLAEYENLPYARQSEIDKLNRCSQLLLSL